MTIIVSDMEGTLTTGSSWKGIRSYYRQNYSAWRYNRFFMKWVLRYILVMAGLMSRRAAMFDWMFDEVRLFRGMTLGEFEQMADWVVDQVMWPGRRADILAELEQRRSAGAKIALVSSSYQPFVERFASKIDALPIGSQVLVDDDRIRGIEEPLNAYEHKAEYIRQAFDGAPIAAAYGDTLSDVPMLAMSADPVAVYPDDDLQQIAEERGWRIIRSQ